MGEGMGDSLMNEERYGAALERGVVEKIEGGRYTVRSFTRDGIVSLPIRAIEHTGTLSVGDGVYFFVFPDGDGVILARME